MPGPSNDHNEELENLSLLKLLHHPSIVELLGCYTLRGTTSFLFPKASGRDLYNFLRAPRSNEFPDSNTFLVALAGLASAVAGVHNFVTDEKLTQIGYHHDIKEGNVLVEKGQFILSDFGLARFKDVDEDSSTEFKIR